MKDFRDVSTLEVLDDITSSVEVDKRKVRELLKKNISELESGEEGKLKDDLQKNEEDEVDIKKKVEKLMLSKLKNSSEEGDVESQYILANYYLSHSKKQNVSEAVKWYREAAKNGLKDAQYKLACFYINGFGVDEDKEQAFTWFEKATEQDVDKAKLCLAICYENGIGTNIDKEKAFKLLKSMEDDKSNHSAQYCLGIYYKDGIGTKKDDEKAFEKYKLAANYGDGRAQLQTAICFEHGIGVNKSDTQAFNRYKKAVGKGNEDAKYLMGHCYEKGIGVKQDQKKAFSIYEELTEIAYEDAMYSLADCYKNGIGTDVNREKAFELYNKLAKMGYQEAKFELAKFDEQKRKNKYHDKVDEIKNEVDETDNGEVAVSIAQVIFDSEEVISISKAEQDINAEQEIVQEVEISQKDETEKCLEVDEDELDDIFYGELGIDVFLEQTIYKQVKDNNLENDLKRLVEKIDKCLTSENRALNFKSLGFKKYVGLGNNKIYGFDFNNKVNDSDRIIACFVEDYAKKNNFNFRRYSDENKKGMILFSIAKHNDQERVAEKISKKINKSGFGENNFTNITKSCNQDSNNVMLKKRSYNSEQDNMTFRAFGFNDNKIIYQEVLTDKQATHIENFINNSNPFILSGIAGSGKTLSTISLIPDMVNKIKNNQSEGKILYVTFSDNLKEYVKSKVDENYYELKEYIDIKTFEDICTRINDKYNNEKIDRTRIITQNSYDKIFTKFLEDLKWEVHDPKIQKFFTKYENQQNLIYSEIFGILKGSMYVKWDRREPDIVKKDYYINKSNQIVEDYKIFAENDREVLYFITQKYNEWLKKKNYYDINDIAFELQDLIENQSIEYEYVVIDEIQDFTEVQIYMLFLLAKEQEIYGKCKTRKILLAGDPNQVINPTFFKIGRLKNLFYQNGYHYEIERLNENFRNSINIMKMNNIVNEIINDKLPARKEEERQNEVTRNNKTGLIEQVEATEENLKVIFGEIDASAKVALIVSDDEKKEYLKERYGCKNAFTISEFKGKEFDNIIAYDILSDYADIYETIYRKEEVKEGHYSYYFNRFYVSITRANYNLVLIEDKETEILDEIKEKLGDDLKYIEHVSKFSDLNLGEVIGESKDLFDLGMKFFYDEKYSLAKNYFERSSEANSNNLANICDLFEKEEKYEEKGDKLFEIGEYKLAQSYYEKAYSSSKFAIMYLYMNDLNYQKQLEQFYKYLDKEGIKFSDLFDEYATQFDALNEILKYKINKTKDLKLDIENKVKNINKLFENINGKMNGR